MKANFNLIILMVLLFLFSELFGLYIGKNFVLYVKSTNPEISSNSNNILFSIITFIMILTIFIILILKLKWFKLWIIWLGFATFIAIVISLSLLVNNEYIALIFAILLLLLKLKYNRNIIIHNILEILTITGVVVLIAPLLTINAMLLLLMIISVYDILSVFYTKHMIYLAEENRKLNFFPGLVATLNGETVILGGGDVGFVLMFALIVKNMISSLFIVYFATIGVTTLYILGKKGKYYPAMPILSLFSTMGYFLSTFFI